MNPPFTIKQIQRTGRIEQFHAGFPIGINRAHIHPIASERVRDDAILGDHGGNNVFAKIKVGRGAGFAQALDQGRRIKNVNAHRGQCAFVAGFGLFAELNHTVAGIGRHNSKTVGLFQRNVHHGHGQIGVVANMRGDQIAVIHLINMIAGQNQHQIGALVFHIADVLQNRIGGAAVPTLVVATLIRLQQPHPTAITVEVPGFADADMVVQGMRPILGQNRDIENARIHAIGQCKINDPIFARKRHRRLGSLFRQHTEACAFAASHNHRNNSHRCSFALGNIRAIVNENGGSGVRD